MKKVDLWARIMIVCILVAAGYQRMLISNLEKAVRTYEERQQALISQDKAIRQELADLKRYIQSGEASGG